MTKPETISVILAKEGMIELNQTYKVLNTDDIKDFSIFNEDHILKLKNSEREARLNQRGPLWEKYQSEFVKE